MDKLQKLLDTPTYHDVIWLVFALAGDSFTNDGDKIFEFFYKWKERMPFGKDIYFSERPPMAPYSEQVNNAIRCLMMGRCIYFWVPQGNRYFWHKGARQKEIRKLSKRFNKNEKIIIKEMAKEFSGVGFVDEH